MECETVSKQPSKNGILDDELCWTHRVKCRISDPTFVVAVWKCMHSLQKRAIRTSITAVQAEIATAYSSNCNFIRMFHSSLRKACDEQLIVEQNIDNEIIIDFPRNQNAALMHEMYCFTCFTGNEEMRKCNNCHRVYHDKCFNLSDAKQYCFYCRPLIAELARGRIISTRRVNDIVSIMHHKLGLPENYTTILRYSTFDDEECLKSKNLLPKILLLHDFNASTILEKLEKNEYKAIFEAIRDYRQIVYNLCVAYGPNSDIGRLAKLMFSFIEHETIEMRHCTDCYIYHARDKRYDTSNLWFLMPCNPPHEIIFAKSDANADFVPAKVINVYHSKALVWFFGDHKLVWVHKKETIACITVPGPISSKLKTAMIEMEKYKFVLNRYKNIEMNGSDEPGFKIFEAIVNGDA